MYSKILLTLDGSPLARAAIAHAAELAKGSAVEVVAVEVIDPPEAWRIRMLAEAYEAGPASLDELAQSAHFVQKREAERELAAAAAVLRSAGVARVGTRVVEGLPANAILDTAAELGVGAIVMATRGHTGLGREVVGSVAEYVVRHAGGVAVVLVGPRATPTAQPARLDVGV